MATRLQKGISMDKRFLLALIILLATSMLSAARKALVIGNASYQDKPLLNTVNDAQDIKNKLEALGFMVRPVYNANFEQMGRAIQEFTNTLDSVDEAVFYYAGHGVQLDGENYLLPVSPRITDKISVQYNSIKCNEIIERMERPRVAIIFLDACRDNPFSWARSLSRGLVSIGRVFPNQCVVFSTQPGDEAADAGANERNSPFTAALLKYIDQPMRFEDVFLSVRNEVEQQTGNKQIPSRYGDLRETYYFVKETLKPELGKAIDIPTLPVAITNPPEVPKPDSVPKESVAGSSIQSSTGSSTHLEKPASNQGSPELPTAVKVKEEVVVLPNTSAVPPPVPKPAPVTASQPETPTLDKPIPEPEKKIETTDLLSSLNEFLAKQGTGSTQTKPEVPPASNKQTQEPAKPKEAAIPSENTTQPQKIDQKPTPSTSTPIPPPPASNLANTATELAVLKPEKPVETKKTEAPDKALPKDEYGSIEVLVNADGEIFIDEHEVAYKSIKKNTILPINQLKTGKCKITFKSVKYMDTKELIIEKDQTQLVEFTFPEPPVPKGLMQISGGSFSMGSKKGDRAEQPVHTVSIGTYAIGITEVTVGQFNSFIQGTRYRTTAEMNGKAYIVDKKNANFKQEKNISWRKPGYEGSDDHPVSCVSWFDAISYCNWRSAQENLQPCYSLNHSYNPGDWSKGTIICDFSANGYRLPTEAEWEFAARAGQKECLYSGGDNLDDLAVYAKNCDWQPSRAASKQPNGFDLYDMSGNVAEWCWDWYEESYYSRSESQNPTGPLYPNRKTEGRRVLRGGSWYNGDKACRVSSREGWEPERCDNGNGFRVVRSLP